MREDIEDVGSSFAESTCVRAEEVHKRQNCNGDLSHFRDGHWHFHGLSANSVSYTHLTLPTTPYV